MNDYQQLSQPLTQEQIDLNKAANASAQFFDKTNALGHAPMAQQLSHQAKGDPQPQSEDKLPKSAAQFDTEAHRAFMRGLG